MTPTKLKRQRVTLTPPDQRSKCHSQIHINNQYPWRVDLAAELELVPEQHLLLWGLIIHGHDMPTSNQESSQLLV